MFASFLFSIVVQMFPSSSCCSSCLPVTVRRQIRRQKKTQRKKEKKPTQEKGQVGRGGGGANSPPKAHTLTNMQPIILTTTSTRPPLGFLSKSILAICKQWRHSHIPMINRKLRQNTHSNGPESRTSKINRRIRPSRMHGMDPLHELRPSTLINNTLVQWLAFTDEYAKP